MEQQQKKKKKEEEKEDEEEEEGEEEDGEEMMLPDDDEIPFQRVEFLVRDWMDFDEELPFYKLKVCGPVLPRSLVPSLPPSLSYLPNLFLYCSESQ